MSFEDCIRRAMDAGEADKTRGEAATDLWRRTADEYEHQGYARRAAEEMAAEDTKAILRGRMERERHTVLRQLAVERRNALRAATAIRPEALPLRILQGATDSPDQMSTVVGTMNALRDQFNGMIGSFLEAHRRTILGKVQKTAQLRNVVREMMGESTGDDAARLSAEAVRAANERARTMFNAAGGAIGDIGNWMPQRHDRGRVRSAGFDAWFSEISPRLDWSRIENYATGRPFSVDGVPPSPEVQRSFLADIYRGIETDGWDTRDVTWGKVQGKALAKRHSDQRILHFRSADDWLDYNDRFGANDPFSAITGHLHAMARDIAMMRELGPSHTMGLENIIAYSLKRTAGTAAEDKAKRNAELARAMLARISGAASHPVSEFWARFLGGVRQTLTAAHLGSAVLVSGSDSVAMSLAAKTMGMNPRNVLASHVRNMSSSLSRKEAAQRGYILDTWADAGNTMHRFLGEAPVSGLTENLSSFVMRAQGLSFWTDSARLTFKSETAAMYANARTMADIEPNMARSLRQRGISDEDFAEWVKPSRMYQAEGGARFVDPIIWRERALADGMEPEEVERILLTIDGLTQEFEEIAIPTRSYEMEARLGGDARPGTIPGELARSLLSYKSYALTFSQNQVRQIMARPTPMSRAEYVAAAVAGFTAMGVLGVQLKEMAKGNEPRPMDNSGFWAAAVLQGGGLGVVGDLANASTTRLGGGLMGYVAGPVVGVANDLGSLTIGNVSEAIRGDDTNAGRDFSKFLARYTPGTTLWQTRAAMDRLVWDQLQLLLDPEAEKAMRREVQRQKREYGNDPYWEPGALAPSF